MQNNHREVFGSYTNPNDTVTAIKNLTDKGYRQNQITVYSNEKNYRTFDATEGTTPKKEEEGSFDTVNKNSEERSEHGSFDKVDRHNNEMDTGTNNQNNDKSVWDSVLDFFTPDTYDYQTKSQEPNYSQEDDILYPHRDEIAQGHHVIVLDNKI